MAVSTPETERRLLFVAITLLVAGAVYSALVGGTKQATKERKAQKAAGDGKGKELAAAPSSD